MAADPHCTSRTLFAPKHWLARAIFAPALCVSIMGCAAQPVNPDAMQIMVKFRPDVTNPEGSDLLKDLSSTANAPVLYYRAMSGGAHVLIIDAKPEQAQKALEAIAKRKDVLYAEPGARRKAE